MSSFGCPYEGDIRMVCCIVIDLNTKCFGKYRTKISKKSSNRSRLYEPMDNNHVRY